METTRLSLGLLVLAAVTPACVGSSTEAAHGAETYGPDSRREVLNTSNSAEAVTLARSSASFVPWTDLDEAGPEFHKIHAPTLRERYSVCGFEAFRGQPSAALCSGFLAGPDIVVTAGHCYKSETACDDLAIVFGFAYENAGEDPTLIPNENVYQCAEVLARRTTKLKRDYAVIRLDRPVTDRTPLPLDRERRAEVGDLLTLIGNPSGLPLKIDEGASVFSAALDSPVFVTTADTYARSSGSMLVRDGLVVGIHVAGASDYTKHPSGCWYSRACLDIGSMSGCPGSQELHASVFANDVPLWTPPAAVEEPPPVDADDPDASVPPSDL